MSMSISKTFQTKAEAKAFMFGFNLAYRSSNNCIEARIDHQELQAILLEVPTEAEDIYIDELYQMKEDECYGQ